MTELSERLSGLLDSEWAILALIAVAILIMYLGRAAAHAAILALGSAIQTLLEVVAGALLTAQEKILNRNREVLLEIGRQARPELYALDIEKPPPLVPRSRRIGVAERSAHDGAILQRPFDVLSITECRFEAIRCAL